VITDQIIKSALEKLFWSQLSATYWQWQCS